MAKRKHRRSSRKGRRARRSHRSYTRIGGLYALKRTNPGGLIKSALNMLKENGPGAVGAAVFDLYAAEPLLSRFGVDRTYAPVAKVVGALAVAAAVDRFAPKYRKHAAAFVTGETAIAARDMIARLAGHPVAVVGDLADQYAELISANEMASLEAGSLEAGDLEMAGYGRDEIVVE